MEEKPYLVIKALSKKATAVADAPTIGQTERNTIVQIASVLDMMVVLYANSAEEIPEEHRGFLDGIKNKFGT